jgi:1,4-dihydroxy-2-naphthoate octaprenyltransferase
MHVTLKNYKLFIFHASVSFAILTAVTITNTVYWAVTPGTPVYKYRGFGEISCLHLQGARIIFHKK